jgi:metal-responsive CopG/Arc/MetJ family transcriptional regulator
MDIKNRRFELRLTEKELQALEKLTEHDGLTSRSRWIANQIRKSAKRKKVWQ